MINIDSSFFFLRRPGCTLIATPSIIDLDAIFSIEVVFFSILLDNQFGHFLGDGHSAAFRHLENVLKGQLSLGVCKVLIDSFDSLISKLPPPFMILLRSDKVNKFGGGYFRIVTCKSFDGFILFLQRSSLAEVLGRSNNGSDGYLFRELFVQKINQAD